MFYHLLVLHDSLSYVFVVFLAQLVSMSFALLLLGSRLSDFDETFHRTCSVAKQHLRIKCSNWNFRSFYPTTAVEICLVIMTYYFSELKQTSLQNVKTYINIKVKVGENSFQLTKQAQYPTWQIFMLIFNFFLYICSLLKVHEVQSISLTSSLFEHFSK